MHENDEFISKSEQKREAKRLQALGKRLSELKPDRLEAFELPIPLANAIADYRRFTSHEAKRRQLQFVGKLMRAADVEEIERRLDTLDGQSAEAAYAFHQLEHWRERLLSEPDALTAYLDEYPNTDRQALRHLLKRCSQAQSDTQSSTAARALFRFLREQQPPA